MGHNTHCALMFSCLLFSASTLAQQSSHDVANQDAYTAKEASLSAESTTRFTPGVYQNFEWRRWDFQIPPELDAVGDFGDGVGTIYYRLFKPRVEAGKQYPLVMALGGLGSSNSFANNAYARYGAYYATDAVQSEHPSYILTFEVPYEAAVNYEAELAYVYQLGEIAKAVAKETGGVDMNRIYSTGRSQGAGWTYELAAVQKDLLAAMLIDAGTTVHTTWGNQIDMAAIAENDVNLYILHGYNDQYIPVNEAYRAFNTLSQRGKKNMKMRITDDRHGIINYPMWSNSSITEPMEWMFSQTKDSKFTDQPGLVEQDDYSRYRWAGVWALDRIPGWATALDYSEWKEPARNETWEKVKSTAGLPYAAGVGGTGAWNLARIRIGDELQTTYDGKRVDGLLSTEKDAEKTVAVKAGDVLAVTVQGYTGAYGNDWNDFNRNWTVDWAIIKGDVTNIALTREASPQPVVRPATVALANGAGPNLDNSLYTWNAIDGQQVYLRIDMAQEAKAKELEVAFRFTRTLGNGEYASYWHIVKADVE